MIYAQTFNFVFEFPYAQRVFTTYFGFSRCKINLTQGNAGNAVPDIFYKRFARRAMRALYDKCRMHIVSSLW